MFDEIARYLIDLISSLFGAALLLRGWSQIVRLPTHNILSQAVLQVTDWLVLGLRRIMADKINEGWICLIGAWLTALLTLMLIASMQGGTPLDILPQGLFMAVLMVCKWALNLLLWMTLLFSIISWISPRSEAMWVLHYLVTPFLNPIRQLLPGAGKTGGGIDFSPLILLILIQVLLMTLENLSFRLLIG